MRSAISNEETGNVRARSGKTRARRNGDTPRTNLETKETKVVPGQNRGNAPANGERRQFEGPRLDGRAARSSSIWKRAPLSRRGISARHLERERAA